MMGGFGYPPERGSPAPPINPFGMPMPFMFPDQETPPTRQENRGAPPACKRAIDSLPTVVVTADDLLEETNKECLICLDPQVVGTTACKLPCGHLYHLSCLKEWLEKHCTCPGL